MLAWFAANWQNVVVAVIAISEIISLFVPKTSGTLAGLARALASLPGVKDPNIGK